MWQYEVNSDSKHGSFNVQQDAALLFLHYLIKLFIYYVTSGQRIYVSPVKNINVIKGKYYLLSNVKQVIKIMRFFCCHVYVKGLPIKSDANRFRSR